MLNFQEITKQTFLDEYWQKKPLVIKNALTNFNNPISADELAGLAMEPEIESKIVFETPKERPQWHLKQGPFTEQDFNDLPKSNWTLLVQGVDRVIPDVSNLLNAFDFLPQWRVDDVMISVASLHGSVGPHYDNYDVFLYQASGQRKWSLTTKNCNATNSLPENDLRIMAEFEVEQEIILEAGDVLYLPAHVGHHGVSISDQSVGYSFGYRSYQGQELWDSFGDFLAEKKLCQTLYKDPNWNVLQNTSEIPPESYLQAKDLMINMLNDEQQLQKWFSRFATQLDQQAMQLIEAPLEPSEAGSLEEFISELNNSQGLERDLNCRIAYHTSQGKIALFINGYEFDCKHAADNLIQIIACQRLVDVEQLRPMLQDLSNQEFLYQLYLQQYILIKS